MTRNTAFEIAKKKLPGIATQFFWMPLMAAGLSDQHELLIELEKLYPQAVLYASPGMRNLRAFNRAYTNAQVHRRSFSSRPAISARSPISSRIPSRIARTWRTHALLGAESH